MVMYPDSNKLYGSKFIFQWLHWWCNICDTYLFFFALFEREQIQGTRNQSLGWVFILMIFFLLSPDGTKDRSPNYKWGDWGLESGRGWPQSLIAASSRARAWTQASLTTKPLFLNTRQLHLLPNKHNKSRDLGALTLRLPPWDSREVRDEALTGASRKCSHESWVSGQLRGH